MQWLIQLIIRHRNISSLFLTTMLSIWMLSSGSAQQRRIARSLTISIFSPFQFTFQQLTRTRNIFAENRRLREDVTHLRMTASQLQEQAAENQRLREMLNLRDSLSGYTLIPARVIAREPSPLFRSVVIDVGNNGHLGMYMPVVTRTGVVGKIIQILPHVALVQILQDPAARVSVMTKRTRSVGILETKDCRNFYIRQRTHVDVTAGDTIVTTGLGGIFPKGLLVGYVTKIEEEQDPLFKKTYLKTSVDFDHLEEVFVMQLTPQWTVLRSELDSLGMMQ